MGGRTRLSVFVVVALFVAAMVVLQPGDPSDVSVATSPIAANGFNFLCSAADEGGGGGGGGTVDPGEFELLRNGLAMALLSGNNLFTFQGLAPPGVPVAGGGTVDPITGGTLFSRTIGKARLGENQRVDFFDAAAVPGASGAELTFGVNLRGRAGQANDDFGMKRLFNQNFGVPDEPGGDITVVGVDIDFDANAAMTALPPGFRGAFEGLFAFKLADGTDQLAGVRVEMNSLQPGMAIPDEGSLSFVFKKPADADHTFYAFGEKSEFAAFDGTANQPGVGYGVDLAVVEPGPVERDVLAVDTDWTAAPRQAAVGLAQLCPDKGHVAWNMDPGGLPDPDAASLGLKLRSGDDLGRTITVDDGAGGTTTERASEVVVDGHVDGLPSLMDFIMLRDAMSFTRSGEVAPDVVIDRFDMADDDPASDDDLPLHATAHVVDVPRHLLFHADTDGDAGAGATGPIQRGELTSWNLSCPGEPAPPGPAAPEDVRRPDLTETLPHFPVGCERHSLTPIPSAEVLVQNWLPEDLDAQAATADLRTPPLDANQFGYFATREVNPLSADALFAFGARIKGVRRGTVDLTEAPAGGDRARIYLERAPAAAADDSARFVVDLDARTNPDETLNSATRVTADATISDLPDALRLDYVTQPGTPLDLTWRADAPFAVTDGTFDAQLAAPDAVVLHGAFETGAVGSGPLPPAARVELLQEDGGAGSGGELRYTAPAAPTDTFPTPDVPAFDPTATARLHAGVELTTRADRVADLGTRLHADLHVPQPVDVTWATSPDGRLESVTGDLCDPAAPAACAGTRLDATGARGPRGAVDFAALLTPPTLPTPTAPVSEAVPGFTDFRPGSGARAVVLGPDSWGADALVGGLAQFFYHRAPLDVAVQLVNPTDQAFRVNLLDASQVADTGSGPRPQVVFADAALDRLPQNVRIRQQGLDAAPDQPWLWVNTEDLSIDDIAAVNFGEDPAGTRPKLTGVLRLGDAEALRDELPFASRPTPARDGSVDGADLWADFDLDHKVLALDASASIEVPRHVAIWKPALFSCNDSVDDVGACQVRPQYEIDDTQTIAAKFRTTSHELGDLNLDGDIHGEGLDWTVQGRVGHVPGSFDGAFRLADNVRLPWVTLDVDIDANAPLGEVTADVFDHNLPVEYRQDADPDGEGQCSESDDQCTANYAVELTGVPAQLTVRARIQGAAEARLTPSEATTPDPSEPRTSVGGIGFVHGQLDLGGTATQVLVEGREADDGQFVGTLRARDAGDAPAPVSGFLNARVDHVEIDLDNTEDAADPFEEFVFDGGGLVGAIFGNVTLGRVFQIITFPLDLLIGAFLEIFFDGDITTRFDLDFDLPLFVAFDHADTVRVGMNGPTLSVDERHPGDGAPATVATRQQSLDHEADLQVDGAFFHHRHVEFSFDAILEDFDISNDDEGLQDIGLFRHQDCLDQDEDDICYDLATNAVGLDQVAAAAPREDGFSSGDILVDFFFDAGNRSEMTDENDGIVEPGVEFYKTFAGGSDPVGATAFFVPDLADAPVAPAGATFTTTTYCCNQTSFQEIGIGGDPPPPPEVRGFGPVCDLSTEDAIAAGPRAVGRDGTEYVALVVRSGAVPDSAQRTLCAATRLTLEAHYPANPADGPGALGPVRWSIVLPTPHGLEDGGECRAENVRCDLSTTVTPQDDGSVQVDTTTTEVADGVDGASLDTTTFVLFSPDDNFGKALALGVCCPAPDVQDGTSSDLGTVHARPDASGHPGFHRPEATAVPSYDATPVTLPSSGADAGKATVDPCAIAPAFGCDPLPDGQTAQWLFGDGTKSDKLGGDLATQVHRYPRTPGDDHFLGILVRYDDTGEVVDKAYFSLTG